MTGEPFAQSKFKALLRKVCATVSVNSTAMMTTNVKKMDEGRQFLAAHGIEELAVPLIKPHLCEHIGDGDSD